MKRYFFYLCAILHTFGSYANEANDLFVRGQRAYDAGLYVEAAEAFEQALEECDENPSLELKVALAHAYHQCGRDLDTLALLEETELNDQTRWLAAVAQKRLHHFSQARDLLRDCPQPLAQWHLGHTAYLQGDEAAAETIWKELIRHHPQHAICRLAELFLARLALSSGHKTKAREQLRALEARILPPLTYECAFYLGLAEEEHQEWQLAAEAYQRALPKRNQLHAAWVPDTLKRLAACHVELAEKSHGKQTLHHFRQAELSLRRLQVEFPKEESKLALTAFFVRKGRLLNDVQALNEANALLSESSAHPTLAERNLMLLLRAEAALHYETRCFFYTELLQRQESESPEYIHCLLLSTQNDLQEGKFHAAIKKLQGTPEQTSEVLLEIGRICALMNTPEAQQQGLEAIRQVEASPDPDLALLLEGILLAQAEQEEAILIWKKAIESYPEGKYADECLKQLGNWYYRKGQFKDATQTYLELVARHPSSPHCGEALYWMARSQENSGAARSSVQRSFQEVYENYPLSPFAPEAYLSLYTYSEYMTNTMTRAHLNAMKTRFPHSPLIINAQYLLGLALKRSSSTVEKRKSPTSRWHKAIEAFHEAENLFERLYSSGLLSEQETLRCATLRCRAKLERALANLAIASDAIGAKKRIYLGYTSDLFQELLTDLDGASWKNDGLNPIREEAAHGLVVASVRNGEVEPTRVLLEELISRYEASGVSKGYFFSRILYQKGNFHVREGQYELGLSYLLQAEEAAKGNLLSPEEKLDLWLAQSHSLQQLEHLDEAMLILSKVINEDAVSGLRIKAMLLRAEIYQHQGRHELAQKQLEATARKGGEWALKAKEKLEKDYGYN